MSSAPCSTRIQPDDTAPRNHHASSEAAPPAPHSRRPPHGLRRTPFRNPAHTAQATENPLRSARVMGFAATKDAAAARAFYEGKLGLRVLEEDPLALMLDSGSGVI